MNKFVERLKELREEKGLTKEDLAKETGISRSAISLYESGQRVPSAEVIIILSRYFGISAGYLLGEED